MSVPVEPLGFVYVNAKGDEKRVQLTRWRESGRYLQGFDVDGRWKTYRIDRVLAYEDGAETRLQQPFQGSPPLPNSFGIRVTDDRPQILFTGFKKEPGPGGSLSERHALEARADAAGFKVVQSVTKNLLYLVCGVTAGPTKIEKARAKSVFILRKVDFDNLVETGELPDSECQRLGDNGLPSLQEFAGYVKSWAFRVEPFRTESVYYFDFREGDVFHSAAGDGQYLQVAYNTDDQRVEVHAGQTGLDGTRRGYLMEPEQLAYWLQTGLPPQDIQHVYRGNSKAGLLAWKLPEG